MKKTGQILKNTARKFKEVFWLLVFVACFIFFVSFTEKSNREILCKKVVINIENNGNTGFVRTENIRNLTFIFINGNAEDKRLNELDLSGLEQELQDNSFIDQAEVYTNINGTLFIDISGKKPLFRVAPVNQTGFYVDDRGRVMPLSSQYTAHVSVISGYINRENFNNGTNSAYFSLMKMIDDDEFLNPLIGQVNVDYKQNITLVPKTGVNIIDLGDEKNLASKLNKIRVFYDKILPTENWESHQKLIVKYKGQIILK